MKKPKVLILCTGNSCRSHMAEGFLRAACGDRMEVYSAGSNPAGYVHPMAIDVMREIGIDLSAHTSEHLDRYLDQGVDVVVTVCGNARDACPSFPEVVKHYHWGFEDPPHAAAEGEAKIDAFRRVRDQIKNTFEAFAAGFDQGTAAH